MTDQPSARQRMIDSAALLMRVHGVEGTSFTEVLEHSGAPRGSIYHHFPGGKAELIEEATRAAGELIERGERASLASGGALAALDLAFAFWSQVAIESGFTAGCPIAAATLAPEPLPAVREAAALVFRSWVDPFAETLERDGLPRERAQSLATFLIAGIEGGVLLTRAQRSIEPLEQVFSELRQTVKTSLDAV